MSDPRPDPTQPPEPTDPDIAADDAGASALAESLGKQTQDDEQETD